MASSGFFKGEKKKQKKQKAQVGQAFSTSPVFTLPSLIEKKKRPE